SRGNAAGMAEFKPSYLWSGVPGHPLHPPLTDATIGTYTRATVAAVLSKLVEYLKIESGTELRRTATWHALSNAAATVFFLVAALVGHGGYADASVTTGPLVLTLL